MEKNAGPPSGVGRAPTGAQGRVLAALAQRDSPTTLVELVEITGLHQNTLRGHLEALHRAGHVSRLRAMPSGRGRPAWSYVAREAPYPALVQALARGLENNPGATARDTGESGGEPGVSSCARCSTRTVRHHTNDSCSPSSTWVSAPRSQPTEGRSD